MCEGEVLEATRNWVKIPGWALVDAEAFVLFRKVARKRERLAPTGMANVGLVEGYDDIWIVEAFPGPGGGFVSVAEYTDEALADAVLVHIDKVLTE